MKIPPELFRCEKSSPGCAYPAAFPERFIVQGEEDLFKNMRNVVCQQHVKGTRNCIVHDELSLPVEGIKGN